MRVEVDVRAVAARHPDNLRHRFGKDAEFLGARPQGGLGPLALGQVRHAANHPDRRAVGVANDVAAVEDGGVGAVLTAEAILVGPRLATLVDHLMDAAGHPAQIIRMNVVRPRRQRGLDVVRLVAEDRREAFVPPQRIRGQVPVPDAIGRGFGEQAEALLASLQGCARLPDQPDVAEIHGQSMR